MQVVKFVAPVWYGARWQCEKVPKHAVLKVLKQQAAVAHAQEIAAQHKAPMPEQQQQQQQQQQPLEQRR